MHATPRVAQNSRREQLIAAQGIQPAAAQSSPSSEQTRAAQSILTLALESPTNTPGEGRVYCRGRWAPGDFFFQKMTFLYVLDISGTFASHTWSIFPNGSPGQTTMLGSLNFFVGIPCRALVSKSRHQPMPLAHPTRLSLLLLIKPVRATRWS